MMSKFTRCAAAALVLCVGAVQAVTLAEPDAAAAGTPLAVDGKVKEVLDAMAAFYAKQKSVSAESVMSVKVSMNTPMGEQKQEQTVNGTLAIEKPNKVAYIAKGTASDEQRVISDGSKLWSSFAVPGQANWYTEGEAPKTLGDIAASEGIAMADGGTGLVTWMFHLLGEKGAAALTEGATKAEYLGEGESPAGKVHRLRFVRQMPDMMTGEKLDVPLEAWVLQGDSPWMVRYVPDADVLSEAFAKQAPGARLEMDYVLSKWQGSESQPAATFAFTPAEGAKKVDSLRGEMMKPVEQPDPKALMGKPAPEFELPMLGASGGPVKLSDHKGKNVVILDFWATWCGPCRKGLPVLNEVAQQFKDKGVVLYAVNLQEDQAKVTSFMEKVKWDVKVLLDADGGVARKFNVSPIPHTVYIGRDGVIHEVEVGLPSMDDGEMKKAFTAAIEDVLKKGG